MEFDNNTITDFKIHSAEVLKKINDIQGKDTLGKSSKRFGIRSSVMYLVTKKPNTENYIISIGHMSKGGSYIPTYNNYPEIKKYVLDNTVDLFTTFLDTYTSLNPMKRVLYIRHNAKKDIISMFSSGNCGISSKVFEVLKTT